MHQLLPCLRESPLDLSIPELSRVLNEKLGLETTRVIGLPPVVPINSLETDA